MTISYVRVGNMWPIKDLNDTMLVAIGFHQTNETTGFAVKKCLKSVVILLYVPGVL